MFLQFEGFEVTTAVDGHDALNQARAHPPDLVVMDLAIPGIDGWEVTRTLKRDGRTRAIPVIAVTGHALAGAEARARAAGCDAFLTKPCLPARCRVRSTRSSSPAPPQGPRDEPRPRPGRRPRLPPP